MTIKLLIIDDDPIFRLGLSTVLESFADLEVISQADTTVDALVRLAEQTPDLVILEPNLGQSSSNQVSGWELCQQIKKEYPKVKILLLSATTEPQQLLVAQASGVDGYCPKGTTIERLVTILRQIIAGDTIWQELTSFPSENSNIQPVITRKKQWLIRLRQSGLQQIEASLISIHKQIENPQLPLFDWLFWSGRKRELLVARWLVKQLLPVEVIVVSKQTNQETESKLKKNNTSLSLTKSTNITSSVVSELSIASSVFDNTLAKIMSGTENLTNVPLEIDILQLDKRQELLCIVLKQIKKSLDELVFLQLTIEQLSHKQALIIAEIWKSSTIDFLGKYYKLAIGLETDIIGEILIQDYVFIEEEILSKTPFIFDLFAYFIFKRSLLIDEVSYRTEAPESLLRAEILLQNLTIQVANGVVSTILNNFSEIQEIKNILYSKNFISLRETARLRNDLSWRYRQEKYFEEPKNIFESKYRLFLFNDKSLKKTFIYTSRQEELNQLRGIPWLVTIVLETRDAIAPRSRTVVAFLGNALVYLLTKIVGRGIGLIGRGIIQGIGSTLQETRYGKNSDR